MPFLNVEMRDPKSTDRQSLADDSVLTSPKSPRAKTRFVLLMVKSNYGPVSKGLSFV